MTTRLRQAGFETRSVQPELDVNSGATPATVATTLPKTGSYSMYVVGMSSVGYSAWQNLSGSQWNLGFYFNYNGVAGTPGSPWICQWMNNGGIVGGIRVGTAQKIHVFIGGASVVSTSTQLRQGNTASNLMHLGIGMKQAAAAASGWVELYIDGVLEAQWTGNTASVASTIDEMRFAIQSATNYFTTAAYFDDMYIDDNSGGACAVRVSDRRFLPVSLSGMSSSIAWNPTGAASNFLCVDDFLSGSYDGDTTYVSSSVLNETDWYTLVSPVAGAISASDLIVAVIAGGVVKKTDAAASTQLNMAINSSGSTSYGSDIDLPTSWGWKDARHTADPATGASWAGSAAIAAALIGIRARGI